MRIVPPQPFLRWSWARAVSAPTAWHRSLSPRSPGAAGMGAAVDSWRRGGPPPAAWLDVPCAGPTRTRVRSPSRSAQTRRPRTSPPWSSSCKSTWVGETHTPHHASERSSTPTWRFQPYTNRVYVAYSITEAICSLSVLDSSVNHKSVKKRVTE